jgi:hypothetical protein
MGRSIAASPHDENGMALCHVHGDVIGIFDAMKHLRVERP